MDDPEIREHIIERESRPSRFEVAAQSVVALIIVGLLGWNGVTVNALNIGQVEIKSTLRVVADRYNEHEKQLGTIWPRLRRAETDISNLKLHIKRLEEELDKLKERQD